MKSIDRARALARRLACIAALGACLGACSGMGSVSESMVGPMSSAPGIGMPADAPARPAEAKPFPAVHDMPPPRAEPTLDGVAQTKMEQELVAARNEQKAAASAPLTYIEPEPEPTASKPAAKPASSKAKSAKPKAAKPKPATTASRPAPTSAPTSSSRTIY